MYDQIQEKLKRDGFAIVNNIFSHEEVDALLELIAAADTSRVTFRKTNDLFAIRQFLKELPEAIGLIFIPKLKQLIDECFGSGYFVVKSIYFDKPEHSNWFVAYHQDLTISVDKKTPIDGFGPWTNKQDQFAVQPTLAILESNFTIRIHLDDTTAENGALKIIPGSHNKGIYRAETIDRTTETEVVCAVQKGGIMLMKPLLLHASGRSTNNNKRRVVHIEFSKRDLPEPLHWAEKSGFDTPN